MAFTSIEKELQIPLVNIEDRIVGYETKVKVHQEGLLHRAFSIFVYRHTDQGIEVLLQKRAQTKYHCGGLWTNTCCSHPYRRHFSLEENAKVRLEGEFGFHCPLQKVGVFKYRATLPNGLVEHEIDHVYMGDYRERNQLLNPNPYEIDHYKWCSVDKILFDLFRQPHKFTPWFGKAFKLVVDSLFQEEELVC